MHVLSWLRILLVVSIVEFVNGKVFSITRRGPCSDCEYKRGTSYQWCKLGSGSRDWDNCSTQAGKTSLGWKCNFTHNCRFHGCAYQMCYATDGPCDYCSPLEETTEIEHDTYGNVCQNYCKLGWFCCRKVTTNAGKTIMCSPVVQVTSVGIPCKKLYENLKEQKDGCGDWGTDFFWCFIGEAWLWRKWAKCSSRRRNQLRLRISTAQCGFSTDNGEIIHKTRTNKRADTTLWTVIYSIHARPNTLRPLREITGRHRWYAYSAVRGWQFEASSTARRRGTTTEHTNTHIRLDRQGTVYNKGFGTFLNYQLQINGNVRQPSSIAAVLIPTDLVGINDRGWFRLAARGLYESMQRGSIIYIYQQIVGPRGNLQCPKQ